MADAMMSIFGDSLRFERAPVLPAPDLTQANPTLLAAIVARKLRVKYTSFAVSIPVR